jgi:hypothetical protein
MSINGILRLAQFKLATECMQEDPNLLLVVGHANLLHSLAASEQEQRQRFQEEFCSLSAAEFRSWHAQSKRLYTMSESYVPT